MKKHSISYLLFSICCLLPNAIASAQSVTEKLKAIGMENIRYAETGECITVTFENNVYRSTLPGNRRSDRCLFGKQCKQKPATGCIGEPNTSVMHQSAGHLG